MIFRSTIVWNNTYLTWWGMCLNYRVIINNAIITGHGSTSKVARVCNFRWPIYWSANINHVIYTYHNQYEMCRSD